MVIRAGFWHPVSTAGTLNPANAQTSCPPHGRYRCQQTPVCDAGQLRPDYQTRSDLVCIDLPAGVSVPMPTLAYLSRRQLIWVLSGLLIFQEGSVEHEMHAGDCLELGKVRFNRQL